VGEETDAQHPTTGLTVASNLLPILLTEIQLNKDSVLAQILVRILPLQVNSTLCLKQKKIFLLHNIWH
jgi:hypothetical protein